MDAENVNASQQLLDADPTLVDIREYVDVIFSCKFCVYTCNNPQGVRDHVIASHLPTGQASMSKPNRSASQHVMDVTETETGLQSENLAIEKSKKLKNNILQNEQPTHLRLPVASTANQSQFINIENGATSGGQSTVSYATRPGKNPGDILVEISLPSDMSSSPQLQWLSSQSQPLDVINAANQENQELRFLVSDNEAQLTANSLSQIGSSSISSVPVQLVSDSSFQNFSDVCALNQNQPLDVSALMSLVPHMKTPDTGDSPVTEIFICSCCGASFDSSGIADHMLNSHGVNMESVYISSSEISGPLGDDLLQESTDADCARDTLVATRPNTTSIGTQAQLSKKPGRKRKVIPDGLPSEPDTAAAAAAEKSVDSKMTYNNEVAIARVVKALGIERVSDAADGTGRTPKRAIHPPRALIEDYHVMRPHNLKHTDLPSAGSRNDEIKCVIVGCEAKFRTVSGAEYHYQCHANKTAFSLPWVCPECPSTFANWSGLLPHLWLQHAIDLYPHSCSVCDFRAETAKVITSHEASEHNLIDRVARPFLCSICGRGFMRSTVRNQHELTHSSADLEHERTPHKDDPDVEDPVAIGCLDCSVCKRTFANRKSLRNHVKIIHGKVKPFSCHICGYVAARKAMLQLHVRTHTGEKPFKCDVCPYTASDHNTLRRHRMRHTGQKPYHCAFCPYMSIQAISLKAHVRTKHPECIGTMTSIPDTTAVFACSAPNCKYITVNQQSWLAHLEGHKNEPVGCTGASDAAGAESEFVQALDPACVDNTEIFSNSVDTSDTVAMVTDQLNLTAVETMCSSVALESSHDRILLLNQNDDCIFVASLVPVSHDPTSALETVEEPTADSGSTDDQSGLQHILTAISEQQLDKNSDA